MKKLYCFDFDGTLTRKDSMFLFLRSYDKKKYRVAYLKHIPLFVFLKLGLVKAEPVKRSFISSVLKGVSKEKLEKGAQAFFDSVYPEFIREEALEFINTRDLEKTDSVIITASLDLWVAPFAKHWGMELLATMATYENGKFTGGFLTPNCNNKEKVTRLKEYLKDKKYDKIIAFGDSKADQPLLDFASESHFRFFH